MAPRQSLCAVFRVYLSFSSAALSLLYKSRYKPLCCHSLSLCPCPAQHWKLRHKYLSLSAVYISQHHAHPTVAMTILISVPVPLSLERHDSSILRIVLLYLDHLCYSFLHVLKPHHLRRHHVSSSITHHITFTHPDTVTSVSQALYPFITPLTPLIQSLVIKILVLIFRRLPKHFHSILYRGLYYTPF